MTTFTVSDVAICRERLPQAGALMEAGAVNLPDLVAASRSGAHPFVAAVGIAFDRHYPLVLSPDDLWLCLSQGFALHVSENAEALRGRFVQHAGKAKIVVRRDEFLKGSPDN